MQIPESIFKAYDIRGIYPDQLNEQNLPAIIQAIIKVINSQNQSNFKIALGRDMRLSSPSLFQVASETLTNLGVDVVDVGLVSTPSLYYSVLHYGCDGGIQISASHNPKNYNGLKIVKKGPTGLIKIGKTTGMAEIRNAANRLPTTDYGQNETPQTTVHGFFPAEEKLLLHPRPEGLMFAAENKKGHIVKIDTKELLDAEVENALKIAGHPKLDKFKIVADTANAMGAPDLEALFQKIPGQLIKMNFALDGNFPSHPPDPLILENLNQVRKSVVDQKADLGLATDGDGDRLMFIDEKGDRVDQSAIIGIVAKELLTDHPGEKILYDIRYIFTPKTIIEEHRGQPVMTRVGHAFITEKMNEEGGIFGGESSGHNFFRDTGNAESQLPVIILVLKAISRDKKPLSVLAKEMKRSYQSEEINFRVENASELIGILEKEFQGAEITKIDGVALTFPDWRFLVRPSNTEPILRLTVEELGANAKGDKQQHLIKLIYKHAKFKEPE